MEREELDQKKDMVYRFIEDEGYKPLKFREMAALLGVPSNEKAALRRVVEELVSEGKCHVDQNGKIKAYSDSMKAGTFLSTGRGFGFVDIEGEKDDVFIPPDYTNGAMHGDKVQILLQESTSGRKVEGRVLRVLERANETIVGLFQKSKNYGFVVADNQKITEDVFVPIEKSKGAVTGHKVVVKITDYGNEKKNPEGKVIEILGHKNDPGVDILSIIRAYGLPEEFPAEVMKQVESTPDEVNEGELAGRMDLRDWQAVTIDGEDAKDLDDAITLTKEDGFYRLGVHIADVTHYVKEGTPLDKEAVTRGTSVYLVDRVIPMLPHKLSNGICSLNEGVDRLALSCLMDIDEKGNVVGHRITESVIHVNRRMSYTSVNRIVELADEEEMEQYRDLVPMFLWMRELADKLRGNRRRHGSIDFDFPESKIMVDEEGKPIEIKPYERSVATGIIEEFMLLSNQTIAEDYFWQELPFVYRCHEQPDPEKIHALSLFIYNFGYHIKTMKEDVHPKEIQKLMESIAGTPEENLISRLALRSMKRAKYSTICEGHFGLSTKYYCHFTSPIRRYPDLQIHRIIKENLHGRMKESRIEHYDKILPGIADSSSRLERRAEETEREVEKLKKVEYMEQFVGEEFEGVVSGVTGWGMYVELPNTVEGMVRVADIADDYYVYDEEKHQLIGEHTKNTYSLGDRVKISVLRTDVEARTIDFDLVRD